MGLARWLWKPATSECTRSSVREKELRATAEQLASMSEKFLQTVGRFTIGEEGPAPAPAREVKKPRGAPRPTGKMSKTRS